MAARDPDRPGRKLRTLTAVPSAQPTIADLGELADRVVALPDGILNCREHRRHDWRPQSCRRVGRGFHRIEVCSDCASQRWQDLDARGLVVASGMTYSEGYLNPPGTGRVDKVGQGVYRLERVLRLVGEHKQTTTPRRRRRKAGSNGQ